MFKICDEPLSLPLNEGVCLRYTKIYDEPLPPNEGACSRYMMNRNHQVRGQRV